MLIKSMYYINAYVVTLIIHYILWDSTLKQIQ